MATVFFSQGAVANSISSGTGELRDFLFSPEKRSTLESLRERATLVLVVDAASQPPEAINGALKRSGLLDVFESHLIFTDGIAHRFASMAKEITASEAVFFVEEDCSQRAQALNLGFTAAVPHALLVSEVLDEVPLVYARVSQLENRFELVKAFTELPIVPFHVSPDWKNSVYVITSTRTIDRIRDLDVDVKIFGHEHDPQLTDPYLACDDRPVPSDNTAEKYATEFLASQGKERFIMDAVENSLLLALPAELPIEEIHFPMALHGHNRRLMADTELLGSSTNAITENSRELSSSIALASSISKEILDESKSGVMAASIQTLHAPYIGDAALPPSNAFVVSRHISHNDNQLVTAALCWHLDQISQGAMTPAMRHNFTLNGQPLSNVIAELPGTLTDSWVIVSAHFDAIARNDGVNNPAPGADDDASGMAGVLATAQVAVALKKAGLQFKHGLRFILFNAEEDYIWGSQQYVKDLGPSANILGVFQMDMIGFTGGKPQKEFEVHAGCNKLCSAEPKSLALAGIIAGVVSQASCVLKRPQIYPASGGIDPAYFKSDHSPFQVLGYAACMISEDYNAGPLATSPPRRENPDYHRQSDKKIDYEYAAEIARVVAAAAIHVAKG